jgi:hypothetical protein
LASYLYAFRIQSHTFTVYEWDTTLVSSTVSIFELKNRHVSFVILNFVNIFATLAKTDFAMIRIFSFLFPSRMRESKIEIGSRVSYHSITQSVTGIVKSIRGDMALVVSVVFNSDIVQWINIRHLTVIS